MCTSKVLLCSIANDHKLTHRNNADLGKGVPRRHVFHDAWELLFFPLFCPMPCVPLQKGLKANGILRGEPFFRELTATARPQGRCCFVFRIVTLVLTAEVLLRSFSNYHKLASETTQSWGKEFPGGMQIMVPGNSSFFLFSGASSPERSPCLPSRPSQPPTSQDGRTPPRAPLSIPRHGPRNAGFQADVVACLCRAPVEPVARLAVAWIEPASPTLNRPPS